MTAARKYTAPKTGKFAKGNPGKPKGAVAKITMDVKQMVHEALHNAGGVDYLTAQAEENPKAFMALVGKTLPKEMSIELQVASRDLLEKINARRQQLADMQTIDGVAQEVENVRTSKRS